MNTNFLTQANVGRISNNKVQEARKEINERWENLGFTKGFNGYLKETMSILFENQAASLLTEATDASNSGSFETVVFPLVRRVFSRLLANDIVSVQAMNMPIGKLFFFLPVTSKREWEKDANDNWVGSHYGLMGYERTDRRTGEEVNRYYAPDDVVNYTTVSGKTVAPEVVKYMKKSLYDLFYNDGLFDHSKGKIHINTASDVKVANFYFTGDMNTTTTGETAVTIPTNTIDGTVRNVVLEVGGFASYNAGKLIGPDGNEMDTEAFLASLRVVAAKDIDAAKFGDSAHTIDTSSFRKGEKVHYRCVTQRYGKGLVEYGTPCDTEGKLYIEVDLAKPTKKPYQTMDGFVGVHPEAIKVDNVAELFTVAWAQYDSLELETELGEVSFKLSDVTVSVEERKLRATWSPEMAQDVAAFHNIDAEAELTAILSEQIAAEIDREILRDLRHGAPWQLRWDYNGWRRQMAFSTNYTQKDWNQTFMTLINQISAQIHKSVLMGGANFVVVSAEISAMLNDLEYFHVTDANAEAVNYSLGIEKIGSLQGRYTVYVDPYAPAESCILGHKGNSLLDTGYIYAPYVPMQLTPTIYAATNFAPVKGIITRYAKKMVNNRFYGAIVCSGLQTWNIMELR
jgi:hypothetical protein